MALAFTGFVAILLQSFGDLNKIGKKFNVYFIATAKQLTTAR